MVGYKILFNEYKAYKINPALGVGWIRSDLLYGNTGKDRSSLLICHYSVPCTGL